MPRACWSFWGLVATALAIAASLLVFLGLVPVISPTYLVMNAPLVAQELVFAVVLIAGGLETPSRGAACPVVAHQCIGDEP